MPTGKTGPTAATASIPDWGRYRCSVEIKNCATRFHCHNSGYPAIRNRCYREITTVRCGDVFFKCRIGKKKCPIVVLYEKKLFKISTSDGENKTTSREKAVWSVAFTKKALLPQAAIILSLKKSQPIGVPLLLVRSVLLYRAPGSRAQSSSVHMDTGA